MISINDLMKVPGLGLIIVAGAAGSERLITWAHVCDLEDPWNWIDGGNLVMTTGQGIPQGAAEQVAWLEMLIDAGASALVVASKEGRVSLSARMLGVAENRRFPVLTAAHSIRFVALAKSIIESTVEMERRRVDLIKRLYSVNSRALEGNHSLEQRLTSLEEVSGWHLRLWGETDNAVIVAGKGARKNCGLGHAVEGDQTKPLSTDPGIQLIAREAEGGPGDRQLLEHVAGLLMMEFRYRAAQRDDLRASGEGLMTGLLDESITPAAVWPELRRRGITDGAAVVCWFPGEQDQLSHKYFHRHEKLGGISPLLLPHGKELLAIVPANGSFIEQVTSYLGEGTVVGLSAPLSVNSSFMELVGQARLASSRALETGRSIVRYGSRWDEVDVFPVTLRDVRALVRKALGPIIDYDRENSSELLKSVRVLLGNNGNWKLSSEQLHVHRQTLVYRIKKAASLGEFDPETTEGSAIMWLAFESARRSGVEIPTVYSVGDSEETNSSLEN